MMLFFDSIRGKAAKPNIVNYRNLAFENDFTAYRKIALTVWAVTLLLKAGFSALMVLLLLTAGGLL